MLRIISWEINKLNTVLFIKQNDQDLIFISFYRALVFHLLEPIFQTNQLGGVVEILNLKYYAK